MNDPWMDYLSPSLANLSDGRIASREVWKIINVQKPGLLGPPENARLTRLMADLGWMRALRRLAGGWPARCFVRGSGRPEWYVFKSPITGEMELRPINPYRCSQALTTQAAEVAIPGAARHDHQQARIAIARQSRR
jgi:hypothetical protein